MDAGPLPCGLTWEMHREVLSANVALESQLPGSGHPMPSRPRRSDLTSHKEMDLFLMRGKFAAFLLSFPTSPLDGLLYAAPTGPLGLALSVDHAFLLPHFSLSSN